MYPAVNRMLKNDVFPFAKELNEDDVELARGIADDLYEWLQSNYPADVALVSVTALMAHLVNLQGNAVRRTMLADRVKEAVAEMVEVLQREQGEDFGEEEESELPEARMVENEEEEDETEQADKEPETQQESDDDDRFDESEGEDEEEAGNEEAGEEEEEEMTPTKQSGYKK